MYKFIQYVVIIIIIIITNYMMMMMMMMIDNIRIGYEGINGLAAGLANANHDVKQLILSDLSLGCIKKLQVAAETRNIKIICEFPSLLTITAYSIADYLQSKVSI